MRKAVAVGASGDSKVTRTVQSVCATGCPYLAWFDDIHNCIDLLDKAHRSLAESTKKVYQNSQQTFHRAVAVDEKLGGLIKKAERDAAWGRNIEGRLDGLEDSQKALLRGQQEMNSRFDVVESILNGIVAAITKIDSNGSSLSGVGDID